MPRKAPATAAWAPPAYEIADVSAVQALMNGTAEPHQQQRALKWIIEIACGTYDMSYRPDSQRDTDFAEGRRFVGLQLVKLTKLNTARLREKIATT
jgi:hypothetical protein